ncbi:Mitochondrial import inner membrane translocase subunit TIM44-1, partial [Bienertia sinuspersici]
KEEKEDEILWLQEENGDYSKLAHNIFPTKENLMKRKITKNSLCVLCGENESASHLFLYCEVSKRVCSCSSLGKTSRTLLDKNSSLGGALLITTLWAIWIHRNNIIFRKVSTNPRGIIEVANPELDRLVQRVGGAKKEDRTQETGNQKGPHTDMWLHGSQQQCEKHLQIDGAWKQKENVGIRAAYG